MLLSFEFKNFKSFKDSTQLNMTPAPYQGKDKIHHVLEQRAGIKVKALPAAALYGANAAGKSNLVAAMMFARDQILEVKKKDDPIPTVPFKLNTFSRSEPSEFEFVFSHQNVLYTYGFILNNNAVLEEWLFAYYKKKESKLFERKTIGEKVEIDPGPALAKSKTDKELINFISKTTNRNQLFLTKAYEDNVEIIKPVRNWFKRNLIVLPPRFFYSILEPRAQTDKQFVEFLNEVLKFADSGVHSLSPHSEKIDIDDFYKEMPDDVKESLLEAIDNSGGKEVLFRADSKIYSVTKGDSDIDPKVLSIKSVHKNDKNEAVHFNIEEESAGTLRMMNLAPALLQMQDEEIVYVIDEIDRSLHPLLSKFVVETFLHLSLKHNSNAQLIFTTHETYLLKDDLLRGDEVWFLEKDRDEGSSHLIALSEYKARKDLRIEKGYLNGRFGAIPFLGDPKELFG